MKGAGKFSAHFNGSIFINSIILLVDITEAFSEYTDEDAVFMDLHQPYSSFAKDLIPRYRFWYLTVHVDGLSFSSYVTPCEFHRWMVGSLVAVSFGLQYSITKGLIPYLHEVKNEFFLLHCYDLICYFDNSLTLSCFNCIVNVILRVCKNWI